MREWFSIDNKRTKFNWDCIQYNPLPDHHDTVKYPLPDHNYTVPFSSTT